MDLLRKSYPVLIAIALAWCAALAGLAAGKLAEQAGLFGAVDDWLLAGLARPPRITDPMPARDPKARGEATVKRNLFCSQCGSAPPRPAEPRRVPASPLPLELVGVMWSPEDPRSSLAVVRDHDGRVISGRLYRAGEMIEGRAARVLRIDPRRLWLSHEGRIERLELDEQAGVAETSDHVSPPLMGGVRCARSGCEVDRTLVEGVLADPTELVRSVRVVPSVVEGRAAGFKLYGVRPTTLIGALGLQNGDTLRSVNGLDLADARQALEAFTRLRSASHVTLTVERRGALTTLDFTIR